MPPRREPGAHQNHQPALRLAITLRISRIPLRCGCGSADRRQAAATRQRVTCEPLHCGRCTQPFPARELVDGLSYSRENGAAEQGQVFDNSEVSADTVLYRFIADSTSFVRM